MFSAMHAKNTDFSKNFEGSFRLGFENAETWLGSARQKVGSGASLIVYDDFPRKKAESFDHRCSNAPQIYIHKGDLFCLDTFITYS